MLINYLLLRSLILSRRLKKQGRSIILILEELIKYGIVHDVFNKAKETPNKKMNIEEKKNTRKISAVIISLVFAVSLLACNQDVSSSSDRSIRRLEQQNEELEAENSELRMQETSSEQSDDDQEQSFISSIMDSPEASGECGENLTWYYKDGVLVITGTGKMTNFEEYTSDRLSPWRRLGLADNIVSVIIDEGVTSIGECAFFRLDNLSKVVLPDSVTYIGTHVFEGCSSLREITMPDSLESINDCVFYNCSSLTEIDLSNSLSLTYIGNSVFSRCSSLEVIYLPDSLKTVIQSTFDGCRAGTRIYYYRGEFYYGQ